MENNLKTEIKIKEILDDLRPMLNLDGGDITFINYEDHFLYIKLTGACQHCAFQDETINFGIEAYIKDLIPEVEGVINVDL